MENEIKIYWNGIRVNGELRKVDFFLKGDAVTFYSDYSVEIPEELGICVINETGSYAGEHGKIEKEHPLYKYFRHAAIKCSLRLSKRFVKKYSGLKFYEVGVSESRAFIEKYGNEKDPGQPTAKDFEAVVKLVEEKKAALRAEREAKEAADEAGRKAAREKMLSLARHLVTGYTAVYPVREGEPTVEVTSSEFFGFYDLVDQKKTTWSIGAADRILGEIDMWQHKIRDTSSFFGYYHKTDFTIRWVDKDGEHSYQGRYDLGDGEGGLIQHIRNFGEWNRTHEQFGKEIENPQETNEILEFAKMLERYTK